MNKTAIKNYAIWARVQLIESAKQKAYEYEVTENGENKSGLDMVGGRLLTKTEKEQRNQLISEINRTGFSQVMEEAAYTWFNRFIALRFMEVNGYLPSKVRIFTDENGAFKPEILKQAMTMELESLDRNKVLDLLDKQNNEELYKYLLITQCNALSEGLPYMFEKIANWTELLFPKNLLRPDSVLGQMISCIPEEDWTDAVQIIGWLYQYYNSELKDETFALLKKNVKITKERIPAATQLFTPDWIVRYMVENSLGRLWYEGHSDFDKSQWKYYLDEAKQEPEVEEQLKKIRAEYAAIRPEEIKVIDPCMGSGHILVYAFDVLMQIYSAAGWSERDAAKSILENNLYGLDIDDRAGQLAYFAVMMKARKHSRRILNGEVKPNVLSIQDSNWMTDDFIDYVAGKDANMKADLVMLRKTFRDAKEYGSILNVPAMNYDALYERIDILRRSFAEDLIQMQYQTAATEQLLPLVKQSRIMSQKYDVVVTNPPYMGSNGMSPKLDALVKTDYPDYKGDLFAVCIERGNRMTKLHGCNCMVTMQSWMFLSSFENMRHNLLSTKTIKNLMHMDNMVMGIAFGTAVTAFWNDQIKGYKGSYNQIKLADIEDSRPIEFPIKRNRYYQISTDIFSRIPGNPVAYWVGPAFIETFQRGMRLEQFANARQGMKTLDNERFLRLWFEVSKNASSFLCSSLEEAKESGKKWFPINHGGDFRKYYGNNSYLVNWEDDGKEIKALAVSKYGCVTRTVTNIQYYFRPGISWTVISSSSTAFRRFDEGYLFSNSGQSIVPDNPNADLDYLCALLNSKVIKYALDVLSPGMGFESGYLKKLPIIEHQSSLVRTIARENISISKQDWDSFETSWDFKKHPLV